MSDGIIQTRSGKAFDLLDPTPEMVDLGDIAHALAHICRYNGHCTRFYSVAEHSTVGARHLASGYGFRAQRAFLLHDAAEAYIGDICTPLKMILGDSIRKIENQIQAVIFARFGIDVVPSGHLAAIDEAMLTIEMEQIVSKPRVGTWPDTRDAPRGLTLACHAPDQAREVFLATAKMLEVV